MGNVCGLGIYTLNEDTRLVQKLKFHFKESEALDGVQNAHGQLFSGD